MSWLIQHWSDVLLASLTVLGGLQAAAWAIAPLTETKVDDKLAGWISKAYKVLAYLSPSK